MSRPITRRRTLLKLVATGCAVFGAAGLPSPAQAASRTVAVRGEIAAIALAGDVLYVARRPAGGKLTVERMAPGQPATTTLRTSKPQSRVTLAASADALAVGLLAEERRGNEEDFFGSFPSSQVLIGGPAGPLRQVASCRLAFADPSVAVSEARVVWVEGGCAEPVARPRGLGPAAIATGSADPAAPVQRVPLERNTIAAGLAASPSATLAGVSRPTFFFVADGEVRRIEPGRLGDVVAEEQGATLVPAGILADGTAVLTRASFEDFGDESDSKRCPVEPFSLRPGARVRTPLRLGGCVTAESDAGLVAAAGERVTAIVENRPGREQPTRRVVSVRGDGTDRRVLARGGLRPPEGGAVAPGRVAWWQARCAGGQEVVVAADGATAPRPLSIAACRAELLSRSARVQGPNVTVRVRCRTGCTGVIAERTSCPSRRLRRFAFGPGTHRLSVRIPARSRRAGRVLLQLRVDHGRHTTRVVKLRR